MDKEKEREYSTCPFLGVKTDPETAFSYPAVSNCCYHSEPPADIDLGYQGEFCLMPAVYPKCKQYNAEPGAPLPPGLRISIGTRLKKTRRKRIWIAGIIVLLGMVIVFTWPLLPRGNTNIQSTGTSIELSDSRHTTTTTLIPSTSTFFLPTTRSTLVPTLSSTATQRPILRLEMPLGIDKKYMIHQILEGDSLDRIAIKNGTTVAALLVCNYLLPIPLLAGRVIVIPINRVDLQGLPKFEVYNVTEEITLQDLVIRLSVDSNEFKYYNGLDEYFVPRVGDWLLVPRAATLPTP